MRAPVHQRIDTLVKYSRVGLLMVGLFLTGCDEKKVRKEATLESTGVASSNSVITLGSVSNVLSGMQASPLESTNVARAFLARGIIRQLPADGHTVMIKHEEIAGLMPGMTMVFEVRNTNELKGLVAGDAVVFRVRATDKESWVEDIHHAGTNDPTAVMPSDPSSAAILNVAKLKPGDAIPDGELLAEDGRTIHFSDLQGKVVAFTFIFTRCPLPDFCPRMSQHFGKARELLFQNQGAVTNWQFLSISFDPEFDKPGVLTRYAFSYRGKNPDRWLFAAAPTNVLAAISSELDFRFANEGGSFLHNLRTVVLDPQGRVFRQFNGNIWTPQDLAQAMMEAGAGKQSK